MTDNRKRPERPPATTAIASTKIDLEREGVGNGPGYSGQEYDAHDFAADRALKERAEGPTSAAVDPDDRFPPDNGRRAYFDESNGEVHGSGVGAGGGNPGEDFDSDPETGDGFPQTGRGSVPHRSDDR